MRKFIADDFINKSSAIHNNKYDYSKTNYIDQLTEVIIICPIHGQFKQKPKYHTSKKRGCKECSYDIIRIKKPIVSKIDHEKNFINYCNDKYQNIYKYFDYKGSHKKLKIFCKVHNMYFSQTPMFHKKTTTCPGCITDIKLENVLKMCNKKHLNKYTYNKFDIIKSIQLNDRHYSIKINCPIHGEFNQKLKIHLDRCGCQICGSSKGELNILNILNDYNIKNISREKKFDDCIDIYELPFDFYLEDYNICIEYDGIQHFKPINFFGGQKTYNKIVSHDSLKTNYCKNNNIKLIRFNYTQPIEEIQKILKETLCENL